MKIWCKASLGLLFVALFVACTAEDAPSPPETSKESGADVTVADFRVIPGAASVASPDAAQQIIGKVFGSPVPTDVWLADQITGAFTASGEAQTLYLLARGAQLNQLNQAKRSLLAVFNGDDVVAQFVPPEHSYQNIRGTIDINGDGMDDVLLTTSAYQMGETVVMADVMTFAQGQRKHLHSLGRVFEDNCDAPYSAGKVTAAKIVKSSIGQLVRTDYVASCPADGEKLDIADFEPVS